MIGVIMSVLDLTCEAKTWKTWLDYIMRKKKQCNFQKVALCNYQGKVLTATSRFGLRPEEVELLKNIAKTSANSHPEAVVLNDVTYVIKSVTSSQLVAFNGSRYLIVSLTKSLVIVALVKYRERSEQAAEFLRKTASYLVKQNH